MQRVCLDGREPENCVVGMGQKYVRSCTCTSTLNGDYVTRMSCGRRLMSRQ